MGGLVGTILTCCSPSWSLKAIVIFLAIALSMLLCKPMVDSLEVVFLMGVLDSLGALARSIVAAIVMLAFAILSFFVTVFIVQVGAGIAGYSPSGDFIVLSAAILATGAIVAGASPLSALNPPAE